LDKYNPIIGERKYSIHFPIPLYTHPVKEHFEDEPQAEELHEIMQSNLELTDEEIMDELVKVKHTWVATTSVWFEFEKEELKKAIRAILRKASEK
jgi:hypothetical protein